MIMTDRQRQFENRLKTFPKEARGPLLEIPGQGGKLTFKQCQEVIDAFGCSIEDLMVRLLPIASLYALVPVSNFQVGAVAKANISSREHSYELYLGANIEFRRLPLNESVHAEQTATMNAWMQGATRIHAMAVSAAPCGHCRQFLHELERSDSLEIITPTEGKQDFSRMSLPKLLPMAFGPRDLNQGSGLMASEEKNENLFLSMVTNDKLVLKALNAAEQSYSPYSHNRAGCAIQTSEGQTYLGRYVENAAFDPSLNPLQVAVSCMNMGYLGEDQKITRAVLVEKTSSIGQRALTEMILKSVAPEIKLEYYEAE